MSSTTTLSCLRICSTECANPRRARARVRFGPCGCGTRRSGDGSRSQIPRRPALSEKPRIQWASLLQFLFSFRICRMRAVFQWSLGARTLELGKRTLIMGIVNVTPDSFSDGGLYLESEEAVDHALRLLDEGADIIDVGGESTRPGTKIAVSAEEEVRRVLPVITALKKLRPAALISIDTHKAGTARAAVTAGAEIV